MQMQVPQREGVLGPYGAGEDGEQGRDQAGQRRLVPSEAGVRPPQHACAPVATPAQQAGSRGGDEQRPYVLRPAQCRQTERRDHQPTPDERQYRQVAQLGRRGATACEHWYEMAHGSKHQRQCAYRQHQVQGCRAFTVRHHPKRNDERRQRQADVSRQPHRVQTRMKSITIWPGSRCRYSISTAAP